jgi:hypothetical protein
MTVWLAGRYVLGQGIRVENHNWKRLPPFEEESKVEKR